MGLGAATFLLAAVRIGNALALVGRAVAEALELPEKPGLLARAVFFSSNSEALEFAPRAVPFSDY